MGNGLDKQLDPYMEDWLELTFLKKSQIIHCYERFREMNEAAIDNDPIGERVPIEFLIENMPELKTNPFSPRLCQVFSSADDNKMNFEDFLDMTSVLSDGAPIQVKADWAFRVFDYNDSGFIEREDIRGVVRDITGNEKQTDDDIEAIVHHVLQEADGRENGKITPQEFRNILGKSAEFGHNFTLRL